MTNVIQGITPGAPTLAPAPTTPNRGMTLRASHTAADALSRDVARSLGFRRWRTGWVDASTARAHALSLLEMVAAHRAIRGRSDRLRNAEAALEAILDVLDAPLEKRRGLLAAAALAVARI